MRLSRREISARAAIVAGIVAAVVGSGALVNACTDRKDSERRECLDRGGVVRENGLGWYSGCWYRENGPVVVVPDAG